MKPGHRLIQSLALAWIALAGPAAAEEVTLTLVSSWNERQNFTAHFLEYVKDVNARGKGVVQILEEQAAGLIARRAEQIDAA